VRTEQTGTNLPLTPLPMDDADDPIPAPPAVEGPEPPLEVPAAAVATLPVLPEFKHAVRDRDWVCIGGPLALALKTSDIDNSICEARYVAVAEGKLPDLNFHQNYLWNP
jgi:hypothetical protein